MSLFYTTIVGTALLMSSCEDSNNYSKLLDKEQKNIDKWLKSEGISVINEFPADSIFRRDEIYHYPDGIYFQMFDKGTGDTMLIGDQIIMRYKLVKLDDYQIEEDYWTTQDRPYPSEQIRYGILTNSCDGWQDAFELMKRSGAHARIIVPSKLGFNTSEVVAFVYEMKIKVAPK